MSKFDLIMPKMGESIMEATILKWLKKPGDRIELDETVLEIATDKVDSEIPSPVEGTLESILFQENDVVEIGKAIAVINTGVASETDVQVSAPTPEPAAVPEPAVAAPAEPVTAGASLSSASAETVIAQPVRSQPLVASATSHVVQKEHTAATKGSIRFYSPLVKKIAREEAVSKAELDTIAGSGAGGRVTKKDILKYIGQRTQGSSVPFVPTSNSVQHQVASPAPSTSPAAIPSPPAAQPSATIPSAPDRKPAVPLSSGANEIVEMDRMRKIIAKHMVDSKRTSPHVTSFVEADVTPIVEWRNEAKKQYASQYGEKLTFTPFFIEAVVKAIADFPRVNVSVDGDNIIIKKNINIGMATALPSGNLIVPVIKNANQYNLLGLTKQVNDLAGRARDNKLKPADIQDGTFTVTNVGTFGNVMGTPIINQPQVAILAVGAIRKKPAVIETAEGDFIGIRHMMFLSLSYDHRVVDGVLGGSFLRRIADYLESFDVKQKA